MQLIQLREVDLSRLNSLFEEEIVEWRKQLHWDYSSTLSIIRRFIAARALPGYVLVKNNGKVSGYCYYIADQTVGFLGDIFVSRKYADSEKYSKLIEAATSALIADGSVKRIECQIFPFNQDTSKSFTALGYQVLERLFMAVDLEELPEDSLAMRDEGFETWRGEYLRQASKIIYDSYIDAPDFYLCRDYQSPRGCVRFLKNLVENAACGVFMPDETLVALDLKEEISGLVLATRISSDTGMIPQISVRREDQGKGIGSRLLMAYLQVARRKGLKRVALSVSKQNQGAYRLYRRIGFKVYKNFHAFIWQRD